MQIYSFEIHKFLFDTKDKITRRFVSLVRCSAIQTASKRKRRNVTSRFRRRPFNVYRRSFENANARLLRLRLHAPFLSTKALSHSRARRPPSFKVERFAFLA